MLDDPARTLLAAAVIAFAVAAIATPIVASLALRFGLLDRPLGYKAHARPTPLLGGLGIALAILTGAMVVMPNQAMTSVAGLVALSLGALIIILAGLLDDLRGLSPRFKFVWQVAAAAAAGITLTVMGIRLSLFLHLPPLSIALLTALWVVAVTNAVNFLDNMNGLCAGLGVVSGTTLAVVNMRSGEPVVAVVSAALAGACLGFLPYNWPRARIFLGDTGSMLIGFLLAALSVMGVYTRGAEVPVLAVFSPLFVLAIPVGDLLLVTLLRLRSGHALWKGDRRHISHRLVRRGMHPATAVAALWAAAAASGLGALLLPTVGAREAPLLLLLIVLALGALAAAAGTRGLDD